MPNTAATATGGSQGNAAAKRGKMEFFVIY
jgi:hypothetical protein